MNVARPSLDRPRTARALALLLLLCAVVFLYRIGRPALGDPDEGRNAEVAREMLTTGDWITPHINGARYLDKPPAYFWTVALSLRLCGVNELGARLPSALFGFLTVLLLFHFVSRRLGPRAGLLAGAILALSPLVIVFARTVIFDMMLTFCMTASAFAAFAAISEGREGRAAPRSAAPGMIFFAAAGLGTITKGPVALVAPLLVAIGWAFAQGRPAALRRLRFGPGLAVYAAVVLPWVIVVSRRNPGFLHYAIVGENLQRVATDAFETTEPFYWYLGIVLPGFFPWIVHAGVAAGRRIRLGLRARSGSAAAGITGDNRAAAAGSAELLERYGAIWFGTLFLFFSMIHSKRPSYMLPLSVPVALVAASFWERLFGAAPAERDGERRDEGRRALAIGAAILAGVCLLLAALFLAAGPGGLVRGISHGKYDALLSRQDLFILTAAGLAGAALCIALTRRGRRPAAAFLAAAAAVVVMMPLGRAVTGHVDATRSSRAVSRFLAGQVDADDAVICFDEYRPGLNFYLQRPIYLVSDAGRTFTSNYIKMHIAQYLADPDFRLIPVGRMQSLLRSDHGAFVLSPRRSFDDLRRAAGMPLRALYEDSVGAVFVAQAPVAGR